LEKMKIAYLSADYPPRVCDGLGIYVESISRELAAIGNTVSIFTIGGSGLKRREGRKGIRVFREVPFPMNDGLKTFLFLGRLEQARGVIQLLKAIPIILEKHPNVKFLIIGKGILEDRVRQEAESLGSVVRLTAELLDQPMKIQHYGIADLCVSPSLYEPLGIEALEAAAMGKPSVVGARGVSGLREIVESWDASRPTGIHMNGWDPKDMAWGVNMALDDPERLKQWGRNARERCTNDFTWRKAAERTLEIYHEVLAKLGGITA
jgi:glycosyltransferase involved in cell wall biosynthesis